MDDAGPTRTTRLALAFAFLGLAALVVAVPHGDMAPMGDRVWDPVTRTETFVHDEGRMTTHGLANAAGGYAVILTLASLVLPYLKRPFATRLHRRLGVPILVLAGLHTVAYLWDGSLRGWLPGMLSFAFFAVHGVTGVLKTRLIAAWGSAWSRLVHRGSGWAALAMVIEHILIASWHFGFARWFEEGRW